MKDISLSLQYKQEVSKTMKWFWRECMDSAQNEVSLPSTNLVSGTFSVTSSSPRPLQSL